MKLEFLNNISDNGDQIVRLYDFDYLQADQFKHFLDKKLIEKKSELDLATIDFIHSINCNLILRLSNSDIGISTVDNHLFYCELTLQSYKNMISIIEPFCHQDIRGFQWLYDIDTPIDLLFSPEGTW